MKHLALIALMLVLTGCVSVQYKDFSYRSIGREVEFTYNTETGEITYGSNYDPAIEGLKAGLAAGRMIAL